MTFREWILKREMAGAPAIYPAPGKKSPDFQWWGAPESMIRTKKRKKKCSRSTN